MRRFAISGIFLFLTITLGIAQTTGLGSWNILNVKYTHSNKLSFFAESQLRSLKFYNHFHYYEYKAGINYKADKHLLLTIGSGSYQTYNEGGNFIVPKNNDEIRLWPQATVFQTIGKINIEQRYRTEFRWTSFGFRNRFRYRLGVAYSFGKVQNSYKPFQLSASNEIFFTNREPYFERNRLQFAFSFKPSLETSIQLGYLHQFDYKINDETGRDFLVVGAFYDIKNKTYPPTKVYNQLLK
jgi:hypothetical protein